jgi:ABC-type glutathione transport system ATPase component
MTMCDSLMNDPKVILADEPTGTRTRATRDNILQTAIQAEKEGFDSLWVGERLLWPLDPQSPYPATPDLT